MRSYGSQAKIGGPVPFSEISEVRANSPNQTSFMRAPRDLDKTQHNVEFSPGPQDYDINRSLVLTRQQSPSSKFDKQKRQSWIDEKLKYDTSSHSPGPQYNISKQVLSKPLKKRAK